MSGIDHDEEDTLLSIEEVSEYYTLDHMLEKSGGFGLLQICIVLFMLIANLPSAFYVHGLPTLEQFPDYVGKTSSGFEYKCSREEIGYKGSTREDIDWAIDWNSNRSLKNWVSEMDLICFDKYKIGLFGAIYFVGLALSGVFLKLSDHYGRKIVIQIGCFVAILNIFYLYFIDDLYSRYFLLFMLGVISFRLVALYILIMEISPKSWQIYVSAGYAIVDHYIAVILPSIYFRFIGNDYHAIYLIALLAAPISFILSLFLPESPMYYYEKRDMDKLKQVFSTISKINKKRIPENYSFILEDGNLVEDENQSRRYIAEMIGNKVIFVNLCVAILIYAAISFNTNLLSFYSKYFNANGYDMAFLMMHADIFGTIIAVIIRQHVPTKILLTLSFGITSVFAIPLVLIPEVDWATMVSVVGGQLGISMCFYLSILIVSEKFPPLFVAFAFLACNLGASVTNIFSPLIAETPQPKPMMSLLGVSLIIGGVSLFLNPVDDIKEKTKED